MAFNNIDIEEFVRSYNDTESYPSMASLAQKYNVSTRTIGIWCAKLKAKGHQFIDRSSKKSGGLDFQKSASETKEISKLKKVISSQKEVINSQKEDIKELKKLPPPSTEDRIEFKKFKDEISQLKKDLKETEMKAVTSDQLMEVIHGTAAHNFGKIPKYMNPKRVSKGTHGVPFLLISDVHFDEIVDPAQINYVNEYNRTVAEERIRFTFEESINILFNKTVKPEYDAMVIALGGDLMSGNIHEELRETNEGPIFNSLIRLTDLLIAGIDLHLKYFDKVFIPCVVGNHGRIDKKPKAKNRVFDNYEWLIYQYIARHYRDDKRVTMLIPDGPDALFPIYDVRWLLTHGDQFRGGNGISGIFSALMLGQHRKQKKHTSINQPFDVMALGHFHQYVHTNLFIINGSIKGYDEYANICNFPYEPPQQALFINHPYRGMVMRTPILCDAYQDGQKKAPVQQSFLMQ